MMSKFGVLEVARTGKITLKRGDELLEMGGWGDSMESRLKLNHQLLNRQVTHISGLMQLQVCWLVSTINTATVSTVTSKVINVFACQHCIILAELHTALAGRRPQSLGSVRQTCTWWTTARRRVSTFSQRACLA